MAVANELMCLSIQPALKVNLAASSKRGSSERGVGRERCSISNGAPRLCELCVLCAMYCAG